MKMFKKLISEVAQPTSKGEQNFKALHGVLAPNKKVVPGVTDQDHIFNGLPRAMDPTTASYENFRNDDESKEAYDKGLKVKNTDTEKDVDESVELEDETIEEKHLTTAELKKREVIVKALKKKGMSPEKAFPIATATAKKVAEEADLNESPEPDYEGQMAKAELNAIADKAAILADMMENNMQLEAWLQSKISNAKMMIDAVHDYMMYTDHEEPADDHVDYAQSPAMASNYANFVNRMGEEVEVELDEAKRGRPRKDGTSKPASDDESQEADKNIHTQLQKAISVGKSVTFNNGETKKIDPTHAHKALSLLQNTPKPADKENLQKSLGHSHDRFHATIKAGKAVVDAARPKVSLGSMRREQVEVEEATRTTDKREKEAITVTDPRTGAKRVEWSAKPSKEIKLDPIGSEDSDVNNDGKVNSTDSYLKNRRKNISANIKESIKANMQKDSIDKMVKMSPQASKEKIDLPPTQGNQTVGDDNTLQAARITVEEQTSLNSLYDSLSEENKVVFEEKLGSDEGLEQLLQFAQDQGF